MYSFRYISFRTKTSRKANKIVQTFYQIFMSILFGLCPLWSLFLKSCNSSDLCQYSTSRHSNMFVFGRSWVLFRISNLCGMFPCYKKCIDGQDHLKPTNGAVQLIKYLIFLAIFLGTPVALAIVYHVTWEDLMRGAFDTHTSKTNQVVIFTILVCYILEHYLSIISFLGIKRDLCELQDFVHSKLSLDLPPENSAYSLGILSFTLISGIATISFPIGFAKSLADYLNYGTLGFAVIYSSMIMTLAVLFIPIMTVVFLLVEIPKFVHQWLQKLQNMVEDPCEPNVKVLREIEKFCIEWKKIHSFISFPLFALFTFSIIQVIVVVFRSLSFFIGDTSANNLNTTLQALGYMILGIAMTYSFVFTSFYGQKIGDQVQDLKQTLHDQYIIDPGHSEELIKMKKLVLYHLSCWENFSGYGFFTLGKSFLTGFLANFVTYIIILIQFQLTEASGTSK